VSLAAKKVVNSFIVNKLLGLLLALVIPVSAQPWRTAYFFQPSSGTLPIASAPFSKYTHVTQADLLPTSACGLDTTTYGLAGNIAPFVSAVHTAGAKALVTLLGDSTTGTYLANCTTSSTLSAFVTTLSSFVNTNGYDGIDIDWEANVDSYPTQWENLMTALRTALPGKTISCAVTVTERYMASAVQSSIDQVNIMNYDRDPWLYTGAYASDTWYNSATLAGGDTNHATAEMDVQYFIGAGVASGKIGIGVPFYGRIKQGCLMGYVSGSTCNQDVYAPVQAYASGNGGSNPRAAITYKDLLQSAYWSSGTQVWDATHGAQYIQYTAAGASQAAFIPYTGVQQIQALADFVTANNLGGVMTFELSYEYVAIATGDARYPLSTAMYQALHVGAGQ